MCRPSSKPAVYLGYALDAAPGQRTGAPGNARRPPTTPSSRVVRVTVTPDPPTARAADQEEPRRGRDVDTGRTTRRATAAVIADSSHSTHGLGQLIHGWPRPPLTKTPPPVPPPRRAQLPRWILRRHEPLDDRTPQLPEVPKTSIRSGHLQFGAFAMAPSRSRRRPGKHRES